MAVEVLPRAKQAALSVSLDDEAGEAVYRASVTIEGAAATRSGLPRQRPMRNATLRPRGSPALIKGR